MRQSAIIRQKSALRLRSSFGALQLLRWRQLASEAIG